MADQLENESNVTKLKNGGNSLSDGAQIKQEPEEVMTSEEDGAPPAFGPASLGLHPVGTKLPPKPAPSQPIQVLNARGMPARIRKKNRFFYDDDIVNARPPRASPKRGPKPSPAKAPIKPSPLAKKRKILTPKATKPLKIKEDEEAVEEPIHNPVVLDRKIGQRIGMRLRNLLKLPKAHKWVCYEWFYSNIDKTLFDGDNDFMICLKESFPQLKCRKLTCIEWTKIRRMMGKPRRCSQAFFQEERKELDRKRQKIRMLQQRKSGDVSSCKDLPNEVPLQLVLGTKVTARLRKPQDGLFTGRIDAMDTSNNTYRVTFDRFGLGTHSVPDYEVLSHEDPETITLSVISQKFRPKLPAGGSFLGRSPIGNFSKMHDPLIGSGNGTLTPRRNLVLRENTMGGFPVKLMELMVRINKILTIKKGKIRRLNEMNTEQEKRMSFGENTTDDFQKRYAAILLELERMNSDLKEFLNQVQVFCQDIAPEPSVAAMLAPSYARERCREEAAKMVEKNNNGNSDKINVISKKNLSVVTDLTAILLHVRSLTDIDQTSYELQVLEGTMADIKSKLHPSNRITFQNSVEIHMQHIQTGLRNANIGAHNPLMSSS